MTVQDTFNWLAPDYAPIYAERVARLQRLRADPSLLPGCKAFYAEHPVEFINDWMCTFDPRNVERGIEATTPFLLFPKQREFIGWLLERWRGRDQAIVEKSRDAGVSWLCVAFGVWMWLFHPGVVIGYGSRKEIYVDDLGNPASLFWKVREAIELLPTEFRPAGWDLKKHAPFMRITNPENGSVMVGEAGDNLGRGNRTSIYFVDEAAFLERPEVVDAALSQTTNCRIDVSTPNGEGNPFARKRQSGKYPVFTFNWRDDPRKDDAWYAKQKQVLDPVVLAQEVDISYSASVANAWIPAEWVTLAMGRGPADVPATGPWKLGVDVARFGDDKTCITLRGHRAVTTVATLSKVDTMTVASTVRDYAIDCRRAGIRIEQIAVDVIGIGAGVVDRLADFEELRGIQIVGVNSSLRMDNGQDYNLRAFMWREMKNWLHPANGPVSMKNDRDLAVDLTALHYTYKNGLLLLESKDDAKKRGIKSPDRADALALTFAVPVAVTEPEVPMLEAEFTPWDSGVGY
jgi:hypothetical protein